MKNHVVWFDIPAVNLERAMRFYSEVLSVEVTQEFSGMPLSVFSHDEGQVAGCIFVDKTVQPSQHGALLYFNADGRLDEALAKVEACGGKVLQGKHAHGGYGMRAIVLDSEGNRIALHAPATFEIIVEEAA